LNSISLLKGFGLAVDVNAVERLVPRLKPQLLGFGSDRRLGGNRHVLALPQLPDLFIEPLVVGDHLFGKFPDLGQRAFFQCYTRAAVLEQALLCRLFDKGVNRVSVTRLDAQCQCETNRGK